MNTTAAVVKTVELGWLTLVPTLMAVALCVAYVIANFNRARAASMWALFGFGTLLFLSTAGPAIRFIITSQVQGRGTIFMIYGLVDSILRAGAYGSLAVAIFAGRPETDAIGESSSTSGPDSK